MTRRLLPLILSFALTACGAPDAPPASTQRPGAAPGCAAGTGYALGAGAAACPTGRSVASQSDLAPACAAGWAPCSSPPAGCAELPGFYVGATGWRPVGGTDAAGGCGVTPSAGTIPVGLGCGGGAMRQVAPTCGGWDRAADLPWGVGVLCCPAS